MYECTPVSYTHLDVYKRQLFYLVHETVVHIITNIIVIIIIMYNYYCYDDNDGYHYYSYTKVIKNIKNLKYLGVTMTSDGDSTQEIK